ncbi:DUF4065 domain-containing protein [Mucilaginibacter terrenus]|uniref:DUF4065 domain-containing protein n=1 Tax=Mucilaginibacter terrenus TaxID=2482727 RepID=A0A3E2NWD6_9SPHI|nr:type II toxin-antitoxin system antitoxin SocA domain-containing protein [Mucilaginibacter terrenus]RFZ85170.1 DUF4065 domain-containing protein [Mucilaginibacter terrenus]
MKEAFKAWKFGPVVPSLYTEYQLYGNQPITNFNKSSGIYSILDFDDSLLGEDAKEAIDYTLRATAHLTAADLSNWTHKKGSPWDAVYKGEDGTKPISDDLIKDYFKGFLLKQ